MDIGVIGQGDRFCDDRAVDSAVVVDGDVRLGKIHGRVSRRVVAERLASGERVRAVHDELGRVLAEIVDLAIVDERPVPAEIDLDPAAVRDVKLRVIAHRQRPGDVECAVRVDRDDGVIAGARRNNKADNASYSFGRELSAAGIIPTFTLPLSNLPLILIDKKRVSPFHKNRIFVQTARNIERSVH